MGRGGGGGCGCVLLVIGWLVGWSSEMITWLQSVDGWRLSEIKDIQEKNRSLE